jgi:hypothetical protein
MWREVGVQQMNCCLARAQRVECGSGILSQGSETKAVARRSGIIVGLPDLVVGPAVVALDVVRHSGFAAGTVGARSEEGEEPLDHGLSPMMAVLAISYTWFVSEMVKSRILVRASVALSSGGRLFQHSIACLLVEK